MKNRRTTHLSTLHIWKASLLKASLLLMVGLIASPSQAESDMQDDPEKCYLIMNLAGNIPQGRAAFNLDATVQSVYCLENSCQSQWIIDQDTKLVDASGQTHALGDMYADKEYELDWIATKQGETKLIKQIKLRES